MIISLSKFDLNREIWGGVGLVSLLLREKLGEEVTLHGYRDFFSCKISVFEAWDALPYATSPNRCEAIFAIS